MKKLSLEKIDFQKQQLILKDSNKDFYYVPVNDEIKNAIYKIEAEQNKIQKTNLSPKEIQRKIRAGFTPEQITQWTDLTLEDINRFAAPIEGEKIIAIKDLQNLKLDKEKPFESIISIVSRVLGKKSASVNDIQWNAIKIDENPWQIEASYHDQNFEFEAKFLFDSTKKLVEPLNQDANFLLDLEPDLEISSSETADNDSKIVSFDDQIKDEYESHNYTQFSTISPNLATAQILAIKPDSSASPEAIESNTPKVSKDAAPKDNVPNNSDKSTIIYRPEKEEKVKVNVELEKEKSKESADRTTVIAPEVVDEPQSDKTQVANSVEKTVVENKSETKIEPEKSAPEAKSDTKPETKVESEKSPSKSQRMKVPSWDDIMLGGSETQA